MRSDINYFYHSVKSLLLRDEVNGLEQNTQLAIFPF